MPPRHYDLAATILAEGVERARSRSGAGHRRGARAWPSPRGRGVTGRSEPPHTVEVLAAQGYEPVAEADGVVRLRNCPFDALVDDHRDLTCSMNLALLEGVVEGVGRPDVAARADPRDGFCCVTLVPR